MKDNTIVEVQRYSGIVLSAKQTKSRKGDTSTLTKGNYRFSETNVRDTNGYIGFSPKPPPLGWHKIYQYHSDRSASEGMWLAKNGEGEGSYDILENENGLVLSERKYPKEFLLVSKSGEYPKNFILGDEDGEGEYIVFEGWEDEIPPMLKILGEIKHQIPH